MRSNTTIRHDRTIKFVNKHITNDTILDLGVKNKLSERLRCVNTTGDLDVDYDIVNHYDVFTAFEIFEHMFAPFNILNAASGKLIASIPLKLWFAKAYWNNKDPLDCHYHEFEKRQFDALLQRTGWVIKDSEMWLDVHKRIGLRPILRLFYKRYYIIYAEK